MITGTQIDNASEMEILGMSTYASGQLTPATGLQWYSFSYSSWWSDLIWYLLNDAWGEQPVGTLPHAVYALICPPLGDQAGLTRGEETDDAFCRRCLKAIAGV